MRFHAALVVKGIVRWHHAAIGQADDFAKILVEILGRVEFLALAAADVQHAIGANCQTVSEVPLARNLRFLTPDDLDVG